MYNIDEYLVLFINVRYIIVLFIILLKVFGTTDSEDRVVVDATYSMYISRVF